MLLGFNIATTVLLVTFGRLSDSKGRVRLYNLGFLVLTVGSVLLSLTPGKGLTGEWELIAFRFIQGLGGAFLFANSSAILTDAFRSTNAVLRSDSISWQRSAERWSDWWWGASWPPSTGARCF